MRFAPTWRFFRKSPAPVHEPDPADLGTAFGMEASLEDEYRQSDGEAYLLESERQALAARLALESPLSWLSRRN